MTRGVCIIAAAVLIQDGAFTLLSDGMSIGGRRALDAEALTFLEALSLDYRSLEHCCDAASAIDIGRKLYRWLDGDQRQFHRLLETASRPLLLTIHCPSRNPSRAEWALLRAPWELLADERSYLAADALLQFSPVRRLGPIERAIPLDEFRLGLAFMAAAPEGQSELDYEAEEMAILEAVGATNLDLLVDESGEAETLGRHLVEAGRPPVLHLSCHGHDAWRETPDQPPRPVLVLEDGEFGPHPTDAPELLKALRPARLRLVFLSACLTAAVHDAARQAALPPAPGSKESGPAVNSTGTDTPAHSLSSALILAGLPAVIGWDGSVADTAATRFAAECYRRLANHEGLALAVAEARRVLLSASEDFVRRNWHLARLWVGSTGDSAAPLVAGKKARSLLPATHGQQAFLGKEVPVASHAMFVSRRRELQQGLRTLSSADHAGILLTGMGRLGKSSLAARIANRRRDDFALGVLHGQFGANDLIDKLAETLEDYPKARDLVRDGKGRFLNAAQSGNEAALQVLGDLLTDLLRGPCKQRDENGAPLLLVLDDFEQLLEQSAGVRPVIASHAGLVATILRAFRPAGTHSRLLITSRFPFKLQAGQEDLTTRLARIELTSFTDAAERKLTLRHQAAARTEKLTDLAKREALLPRAQAAARGNPGLLQLMSGRLVLNPAVPLDLAEAALVQMEKYLAEGTLPQTESLREELEAIAVETLLDLAGYAGRALLRAITLFELPVPHSVAEAVAKELGGNVQTLIDLALAEPGQDPVLGGQLALRVSPLAASRLPTLTDNEKTTLAAIAAMPLFNAWGGKEATRPAIANLQLARLAHAAADPEIAAASGASALRALEGTSYKAAADLAADILTLLDGANHAAPLHLLAVAARVIGGAGEGDIADELLAKGVARFEAGQEADPADALPLLDAYAARLHRRGKLDEALRIRQEEELPVYERLGDVHSKAVTMGQIADILQARGQLDEALRIRQEEQLPVYERLGDVRSKAVTMGKIADILQARGQLDEALRIYREELLPAFERLGDVREKAMTMGNIADILQARGQLDEALRIRQEEQLPVYERLGDVSAKAMTMGNIADILQARGQLDEALRIRQEEQLPVYERLGDVRAKAVTMGKIADILQARGQLDEALRLLKEEVLAVFERLGDVREKAVTMGKIADILQARGQLDEALRIRQEEQLPVYERLGDVREKAVTTGKIADILQARGQLDEALRIRQEEQLPVYERLGDVREKAVTTGKIADILQARGQLDEALRIRQEEQLPVYERLGDVRAKAVTMGKIADILQARGQLDEALRIRQEEELPVYERLGDVSAKAMTMGKIAAILQARGQLDEALRLLKEEVLAVFERLGDVSAKAVTKGYIADILQARGQLDEALRIRQEEELPVYERLGDVREKAVTMGKIADILQARGQLDEALRIRQEEQLPVYERLGDVRAKAVTMGKIADILQARGQLDEALRIRQEEQLPVYERLGDVRSKAVTMGKIADILQARGQLDEALRIRQEEELPVYERLGDVRSLLVCRAKIALTLMVRKADDDRERANSLLCVALADARRLRIPEADQIQQILEDFGMTCG